MERIWLLLGSLLKMSSSSEGKPAVARVEALCVTEAWPYL